MSAPEFESKDGVVTVFDSETWMNACLDQLPGYHKCMFADQCFLFYVGGPNARGDFHLQQGEEIFYQLRGDLQLRVLVNGKRKKIAVHEGEIFVLPPYVEHCPERQPGAYGCILERQRKPTEIDCLRNFTHDGDNPDILWERWIHFDDFEKELDDLLKAFDSSEAKQTGKPDSQSFVGEPKYQPNKDIVLPEPIHIQRYIDQNWEKICESPQSLFPTTRAAMLLYGPGKYTLHNGGVTLILQFQRGTGELDYQDERTPLKEGSTAQIRAGHSFSFRVHENSCCMTTQIFFAE